MNKLENDRNVYILGAGFSVDRGLPTIKNFMFVMRDAHNWLEANGRKVEADAIASVLQFRQDAAAAAYRIRLDLENIEELFSLASASSRKLTKEIQIAIAATIDFKLKTSSEREVRFQFDGDKEIWPKTWKANFFQNAFPVRGEVSCKAYEYFLTALLANWNNDANYNDNSFITFNYDLLLENALDSLAIPYTYGFTTKQEKDSNRVEVLKLHGSLNWSRTSASNSYSIHKSYDELQNKNLTPELIPPTWRKLFTGQLRQVWDRSLKSIENATRIVVIGFSMPETDSHFKYLIAAGLQNNISLREIVFVNPDKELIEKRANLLFGEITKQSSVEIIGCGLSDFLKQGTSKSVIGGHGRPIPSNIQNIY